MMAPERAMGGASSPLGQATRHAPRFLRPRSTCSLRPPRPPRPQRDAAVDFPRRRLPRTRAGSASEVQLTTAALLTTVLPGDGRYSPYAFAVFEKGFLAKSRIAGVLQPKGVCFPAS